MTGKYLFTVWYANICIVPTAGKLVHPTSDVMTSRRAAAIYIAERSSARARDLLHVP